MNFGVIVHPFLYCFIINWINACIKKKKKPGILIYTLLDLHKPYWVFSIFEQE